MVYRPAEQFSTTTSTAGSVKGSQLEEKFLSRNEILNIIDGIKRKENNTWQYCNDSLSFGENIYEVKQDRGFQIQLKARSSC